jgi:hypothetical protein
MLDEEDRGFRDDWDDLMWTLSDDEMPQEAADGQNYAGYAADFERYSELHARSELGGGRDTEISRTISQEEKEHWKTRNRRI